MSSPRTALVLALVLLVALATACSAPPAVSPSGPSPSPPPLGGPTEEPSHAVVIRIAGGPNQFSPGASAQLNITFEPVIQSVMRRADGTPLAVSQKPWPNHNVAQLSYCVMPGTACTPGDSWQPFAEKAQATIAVNWLGEREIWVVAQFRDASGAPVAGIDENQRAGQAARNHIRLIAQVDARTPDNLQPAFVQTAVAATRVAFPVTGSVQIAGGRSVVGGKVGTQIDIPVSFEAHSTAGAVTEMRVGKQCPRAGESLDAPWEPFAAHKDYTATAALNFVGWYIAVQYRDAQGRLSPVYCADISVEGSP